MLTDIARACGGQVLNESILQYPDFSRNPRRAEMHGKRIKAIAYWKLPFDEHPPTLPTRPLSVRSSRAMLKVLGGQEDKHAI